MHYYYFDTGSHVAWAGFKLASVAKDDLDILVLPELSGGTTMPDFVYMFLLGNTLSILLFKWEFTSC